MAFEDRDQQCQGPGFLDDLGLTGAGLTIAGKYRVDRTLGRGAMGVVYAARQLNIDRWVAVKMLTAGDFAGDSARLRFEQEAKAVGGLRHPNIIMVHDWGEDDGQPYLAMEYMPAGSLAGLLPDGPLEARRAASVVEACASAMQHAHEHGVVHRDLKPGNILLDEGGSPKVADFGLAKFMEGTSGLTLTGQMVGTPGYMAPEQASDQHGDVGPSCDVYALGAVLYHLLTGRAPFQAGNVPETLRQVIESDPASPRSLNSSIPRDLETITLKCLSKRPAGRYATAEALRADLGRFLGGEPIAARRAGMVDRVFKWYGRRRLVAGLVTALVVLVFVGLGLAAWQAAKIRRSNIALTRMNTRLRVKEAERLRSSGEHNALLMQLAQAIRENPNSHVAPNLLMDLLLDSPPFRLAVPPLVHDQLVVNADYLRDGARILTASMDGRTKLWDATRGGCIRTFEQGGSLSWYSTSHSEEVLLTGGDDGTTVAWSLSSGQRLYSVKQGGVVNRIDVREDDQLFITASGDGTAQRWRVADGSRVGVPIKHAGPVIAVRFRPGGGRILTAARDATVRLTDPEDETLPPRVLQHPVAVEAADYSPDGKTIVSAAGTSAYLWRYSDGAPIGAPLTDSGGIRGVRFSPDGKEVVTASWDGSAGVWSATTGQRMAILGPFGSPMNDAVFSQDGRYLATASEDSAIRLWSGSDFTQIGLPAYGGRCVYHLSFSPDGRSVVGACDSGGGRIWRVPPAQVRSRVEDLKEVIRSFSEDNVGGMLYASDQRLWLEDATHRVRIDFPTNSHWKVTGAQVSRSSSVALLLAESNVVHLCSVSGEPRELTNWTGIADATLLGDGTSVALASTNGVVDVYATANLRQIRHWRFGELVGPMRLAGCPSRDRLGVAVGTNIFGADLAGGGAPRLLTTTEDLVDQMEWDQSGSRLLVRLHLHGSGTFVLKADGPGSIDGPEHENVIQYARFSRDSRLVATGSEDGGVKVWDAGTGNLVGPAFKETGAVIFLAWDSDGDRLLVFNRRGTVRLWDPKSGLPLSRVFPVRGDLLGAGFGTDQSILLALGGQKGLVRIPAPHFLAPIPRWLPDLADLLAGAHATENESQEEVNQADFFTLAKEIEADSDSPYRRWFMDYWKRE